MSRAFGFFVSLLCLGALLVILSHDAVAQEGATPTPTPKFIVLEPAPSDTPHVVDMTAIDPSDRFDCTVRNLLASGTTPTSLPNSVDPPVAQSQRGTLYIQMQNDSEFQGEVSYSFLTDSINETCSPDGANSVSVDPGAVFGSTIAFELQEVNENIDGRLLVQTAESRVLASLPITLQFEPDWTTAKAEPNKVQLLVTHGWPALIESDIAADVALGLGLILAFLWLIWYTFQRFSDWLRQNERNSRWPWILAGIAIAILPVILGKYWNEPGRPFGSIWIVVTAILALMTAHQMWSYDRARAATRKPLKDQLISGPLARADRSRTFSHNRRDIPVRC